MLLHMNSSNTDTREMFVCIVVFLTAKPELLRPPSNDKPAGTDSVTDVENFH